MSAPLLRDYQQFDYGDEGFVRLSAKEARAAVRGSLSVLYRPIGGLPEHPENVRYLGRKLYLKCDAPPDYGTVSLRVPCVFDAPELWVREAALIAPVGVRWRRAWTCLDPEGRERRVGYAASLSRAECQQARELGAVPVRAKALPRWASRATLHVRGAQAVPVQDVTEAEAIAMGAYDILVPQALSPEQRLTCGSRVGDAPHRADFAVDWDTRWGDTPSLWWKANPYAWRLWIDRVEVRHASRQ